MAKLNLSYASVQVGRGIICLLLSMALASAHAAGTIKVVDSIPYDPNAPIAQNIKTECGDIGIKLSKFLQQFAKKQGITIQRELAVDYDASGFTLKMLITNAQSHGAAGLGHSKLTAARGWLYKDGELVATNEFTRHSMGGAFGAWKSSCAVLGRNSKALGKDFATWLSGIEALR